MIESTLRKTCNLSVPMMLMCIVFLSLAVPGLTQDINQKNAVAKIIDCSGPVKICDAGQTFATPNLYINEGDTIQIAQDGYVTLLLSNGSIKRFGGPATLTMTSIQDKMQGTVLNTLGKTLLELFFSRRSRQEDVYLGVRDLIAGEQKPLRVPCILYPPPGSSLMHPPKQLHWRPIDGVYTYSVTLFDKNRMLWQGKTDSNTIEPPQEENLIHPGVTYLWVVDAEIGERTLRSEQGTFVVLDQNSLGKLNDNLVEIQNSIKNEKLACLLRAQVYREYNCMVESYGEIKEILMKSPGDFAASVFKAALLEDMGFFEEAVFTYRHILGDTK